MDGRTDVRTDERTNGRKLARLCLPAKAGATIKVGALSFVTGLKRITGLKKRITRNFGNAILYKYDLTNIQIIVGQRGRHKIDQGSALIPCVYTTDLFCSILSTFRRLHVSKDLTLDLIKLAAIFH